MIKKRDLLAKKKRKLEAVRKRLKADFIGIDEVIDQVVDSIKVWYCVPDAISRPTIINLWGMTGVGKTDLVRKLVRYLGMSDKYVEVIMSSDGNNGGSWNNSAQSVLFDSDIEQGKPGIILFDEIQKYRTKDEKGMEIEKKYFNDLWVLLSDGKFSAHGKRGQIESFLQRICMHQYDEEKRMNASDDEITPEVIEEVSFTIAGEEGISKADAADMVSKHLEAEKQKRSKKKYREFHLSSWEAERFKKMLNIDTPISQIVRFDENTIIDMLMEGARKPELLAEDDYSKMLVFISGNLDEAYTMADDVEDTDRDADAVRAWTDKIDITVIKSCLMKRFRAEQIARFGNDHVIYRSLSSDSYRELIRRKVNEAARQCSLATNIRVRIRKTVNALIYENGVYPTQGTRPVFSTVSEVVSKSVPDAIMKAVENGADSVTVGYDPRNREFVCEVGSEITKTPYTGAIDGIKDDVEACADRKALIAAHEAGHALAYAVLFGAVPVQISPASSFRGGFVMQHQKLDSKKMMYHEIVVALAGRAAEQIVFGEDHVSEGALSDMASATMTASAYIRKHGFSTSLGYFSSDPEFKFMQRPDETDKCIAQLMDRALADSKKLIEGHSDAFMALACELRERRKVEQERVFEILHDSGVRASVVDVKKQIISKYSDCFEAFRRGREAISAGVVSSPFLNLPSTKPVAAAVNRIEEGNGNG